MRILLLLVLVVLSTSQLSAQRILKFEDIGWETVYDPTSLKDAEIDSVYVFTYWGNSYFTDGEESNPDTVFNAEDLLKCRNLQSLKLNSVDAKYVVENLAKFPLLQELELRNVNLDDGFPSAIYSLKELKSLALEHIYEIKFDREALKNSQIEKLELFEFGAGEDEEGNRMLHFSVFPNLTDLYLGRSSGDLANDDFLANCTKLKRLDLSDCEWVREIDLSEMDDLEFLNLSSLYSLTSAPAGMAYKSNLKEINIRSCSFDVTSELFAGCDAVEILLIDGCAIEDLSFVGEMSELMNLTLSNNGLSSLPAELSNCAILNSLTCSDNSLTEIPKSIFNLKFLSNLELKSNAIRFIPKGISGMESLTNFDMSYNPGVTIEQGAFNLPKLKYLELNYCAIKSLPADIGNLKELYELELMGDSLTTIPASVLQLGRLSNLNLSYNQINKLPSGWAGLTNIYSVNLSGNKISSLPKDFYKMSELVNLNLESNSIVSLPSGLVKMTKLVYLSLNGNAKIKYLKGLEKMPKLSFVYINSKDVKPKDLANWKKKLGDKLQVRDY